MKCYTGLPTRTVWLIILKSLSSKEDRRAWIGFIWLRIWGKWQSVVNRVMKLGFHETRGNFLTTWQITGSQTWLRCMQLVIRIARRHKSGLGRYLTNQKGATYVQHNNLARWRYHNCRGNATIHFVLLTFSPPKPQNFRNKKNWTSNVCSDLLYDSCLKHF